MSEFDWDNLPVVKACTESLAVAYGSKNNSMVNKQTSVAAFEASSSLESFIDRVSKKNSGPRHLLELFLVHVAMHPANVFGQGNRDLTSCVLDCE